MVKPSRKFSDFSRNSSSTSTNPELRWTESTLNKLRPTTTSWKSPSKLSMKPKPELMPTTPLSTSSMPISLTKKTSEILPLLTEIKLNLTSMKRPPDGKVSKPLTKPTLLSSCTSLMPSTDVLRSSPLSRCLMTCSLELIGDHDKVSDNM